MIDSANYNEEFVSRSNLQGWNSCIVRSMVITEWEFCIISYEGEERL